METIGRVQFESLRGCLWIGHKIKINNLSFKNNILAFNLNNYQQKKYKNKNVGLFKVTIKILNNKGNEISSDEKEVTSLKDRAVLRVPIRRDLPERSHIVIIAHDLISGDETTATHSIAD